MKTAITDKIYWSLGFLFLGFYFWIIYQNTYNIPRWDDYPVFFQFLCDYIDSTSIAEKLALIFKSHGLHRLIFTKLIVLLSYGITGKINITAFIVIGNLFLLGIGAMFFIFLRKKENAGIFALMIILLLFNGQNFETSTWAMAGLANVGVQLLTMLSIWFILRPTKSGFITGLVLSVITIFSNGNGMCLFPAVLFSFFLQKRKKEMLWFSIVAGSAVICYFLDFNWTPDSNKLELSHRISVGIMSFFNFLGGNLWLPSAKIIAFLMGLFVFATYIWAFSGKFYRKNIVWFTFFTFMLLTSLMLTLNRNTGEIPLRYRIYCCMGTILTAMFFFENQEVLHITRWFKYTVPPVMLFSLFCSILYMDKAKKDSEFKKISTYNWYQSKSGLHTLPDFGVAALPKIEALHIYTMPKIPIEELAVTTKIIADEWQNRHSHISYHIDFIEETSEGYVLIKGWAYTDEMSMDFTDIFLWLFNGEQQIKVHPYFERRYDIASSLTIMENCGFYAIIPKAGLPQGNCRLGIEIQKRYIVPVKKSVKSIETEIQIKTGQNGAGDFFNR
jgi:hypothetical protein